MDEIEFYLIDLKSRFDLIDKTKYMLAYSGGKDSHFLLWFIKEYLKDTEIEIVSSNTFMEHDEIKKRMIKYSDKMLIPELKPFQIKERYGSPLFSKMQDDMIERYQRGSRSYSTMKFIEGNKNDGFTYFKLNNKAKKLLLSNQLPRVTIKCCTYLKKKPMQKYEKETGKKSILGVRSHEGILRKKNYKSCFTKKGKFTPIWDLSDEMIDAIYQKYNIEIPKIYDYIDRTGCMGCPYGYRHGDTEKELAILSENQRKFVIKYFKESYDILGVDYQQYETEVKE